jgi:hypothetical protein
MRSVDVVGLGINAIDTVLEIDRFPALGAKERILRRSVQAGGPIATALVTCRRLGLSCRYIGKVGETQRDGFRSPASGGKDWTFVRYGWFGALPRSLRSFSSIARPASARCSGTATGGSVRDPLSSVRR